MPKRAICFLLAAVIVLGLFCGASPRAAAASDMSASESCVALLKTLEGFVSKPYYDHKQWTVGYGTACPEEDLARYQASGISAAEADKLLREYVAAFEKKLNAFISSNGLSLNQQQFDALISFTYNVGYDWMNNDSDFRTAVLKGSRGNDFLFAIGRWCAASGKVHESLIKRRLVEANLYLNGVYSATVPENYKYVIYDDVLEDVVNDVRVQAYDATKTSVLRSTPGKSGYRFLGWYDAEEGGAPVTSLGPDTTLTTLYAHWQNGDGITDEEGNVVGVPAKYKYTVTNEDGQAVRKQPNLDAKETKTLKSGKKVTIVADYIDDCDLRWAELSSGGWICLSENDSGEMDSVTVLAEPVIVEVVNSYVNIRSGAGVSYTCLGKANRGDELTVTKTKVVGKDTWGRFTGGWVCLSYTNFELVMEENSPEASVVTARGTVRTNKLNVRSGPGTKYDLIGTLAKGDKVEITLQKQAGVMVWGRLTTGGWIWLDYVDLTPVTEADGQETEPAETEPEPTEATEATEPAEVPETAEPTEAPEAAEPGGEKIIATGTVTSSANLNVRSAAGLTAPRVASLAPGTSVAIYETATANNVLWGRIEQGWICLTGLVTLNSGADTINANMGTVVNCASLNVRSGAGVFNAKVGSLPSGTRVEILETVKVYGSSWGRIEQGWIHMRYVSLDSDSNGSAGTAPSGGTSSGSGSAGETDKNETTGSSGMMGTVYKTDKLTIRSAAGIQNDKVGTYSRGTRVYIRETTRVGSVTWGRTSKGWISLYYVELDQDLVGKTKTVTVDSLNIRSEAGAYNAKVGTYAKGTKVKILETKILGTALWGRTDKGWISMEYVQ